MAEVKITSVIKTAKPKAVDMDTEDAVPEKTSPLVSSPSKDACCRLPQEKRKNPLESPVESVSTLSPERFSSTTKSEDSGKKVTVAVNVENVGIKEKSGAAGVGPESGNSVEHPKVKVDIERPAAILPTKPKRIPVLDKSASRSYNPSNVAVPRSGTLRKSPANLDVRPLVIATHLVPSLPIGIFEIFAEIVEAATDRPVVLLYEPRVGRPIAKDIADIAILPASDDWTDGTLLPVSFVFEHRLNKDKNPAVYVDVVVATDCTRHIEEIIDLRGYRCALPDRRKTLGAAGLLFNHLKSKGENPSFFGNTLDTGSQIVALQMVAGKQAEVGVIESPIINCHKRILPGVDSLFILASLGPLPPYRIMLNKKLEATLCEKIKKSLLNVDNDIAWKEKLNAYGISGFAEYSENRYNLENMKSVVTSVPYY